MGRKLYIFEFAYIAMALFCVCIWLPANGMKIEIKPMYLFFFGIVAILCSSFATFSEKIWISAIRIGKWNTPY